MFPMPPSWLGKGGPPRPATNLPVIPAERRARLQRLQLLGQPGLVVPDGTSPSITIDMGAPQVVSSLIYEPRQGASPIGAIGRFEVSVSADGVHFETVSTGTWANTTAIKQIGIDAVTTRFVRLTALSTASGSGSDIAAAEIYLRGAPHVAPTGSDTVREQTTGSDAGPGPDAVKADTLSTNPAVVGQWGPTIGFPLVPVAAALLPNNEMLVWSADQDLAFGASDPDDWTQTAILNLTTGAVSEDTVTNTDHNMFCPGVVVLPNGDIMVTGGLSDQQTSIYDPTTNSWSAGPQMNIGRGYQGMTLLSNQQAFTLGGSWSGGLGTATRKTGRGVVAHRRLAGADRCPGDTDVHPGCPRASTGPTTKGGSSPPPAGRSSRPGPRVR